MVDFDAPGALFFAGHAAEDAVVIADELVKANLITFKRLNFCKTNSTNQGSHLSSDILIANQIQKCRSR